MVAVERFKHAREAGHPFDAVLLDLEVPGAHGGREAIAHLTGLDPHVRAILVSGYAQDSIMSAYREYRLRRRDVQALHAAGSAGDVGNRYHDPLVAGALSHNQMDVDVAVQPGAPRAGTIRIVIADESPIFRDGLRRLLEADTRLRTVGDTRLGSTVPALVGQLRPDVLLLGAASSGNLWADTLRGIASEAVSVRTILLANAIDTRQVTTALQSGAAGVLAKDSAPELLFKSIEAVMAGECWVGTESSSRSVTASVRRLDHDRRHALGFGLHPAGAGHHPGRARRRHEP